MSRKIKQTSDAIKPGPIAHGENYRAWDGETIASELWAISSTIGAVCRLAVCSMGVEMTELLAIANNGLERIPAKEVATKDNTKPTCNGRIPTTFQRTGG